MTEFVMLPIFSEDGRMTKRSLKVDTRHFLGSAGSEIAHRFIEVIDDTAEFEMELVDRIISGLPPRDFKKSNERAYVENARLHSASLVSEEEGTGTIKLVRALNDTLADQLDIPRELMDVSSAHPKHDWWRTIPGFSRYDMSSYRAIAESATGMSVSIVKGMSNQRRLDNVLLSNDDGVLKRMSVDHLFKQTFPELS
jgi:hypothetical protein